MDNKERKGTFFFFFFKRERKINGKNIYFLFGFRKNKQKEEKQNGLSPFLRCFEYQSKSVGEFLHTEVDLYEKHFESVAKCVRHLNLETKINHTQKRGREKEIPRHTSVSFADHVATLLKFTRVHGFDDFTDLTGVQIFEEVILHNSILDQLFGSVCFKSKFKEKIKHILCNGIVVIVTGTTHTRVIIDYFSVLQYE